jgi:hypothetical protein
MITSLCSSLSMRQSERGRECEEREREGREKRGREVEEGQVVRGTGTKEWEVGRE